MADISDEADQDWDKPVPYPRPIGLEGARWTVHIFDELGSMLPEKFELIDGKLFWSERERVGMLAAMLEQMGLVAAVRLAPKELWLEALRIAEETPE
jgi:hypothetical protein